MYLCAVYHAQNNYSYIDELQAAACSKNTTVVKRNGLKLKMQFFKLRGNYIYHCTRRHIPDDLDLHEHCSEELKIWDNSELLQS
jgi:hypothetical protein